MQINLRSARQQPPRKLRDPDEVKQAFYKFLVGVLGVVLIIGANMFVITVLTKVLID